MHETSKTSSLEHISLSRKPGPLWGAVIWLGNRCATILKQGLGGFEPTQTQEPTSVDNARSCQHAGGGPNGSRDDNVRLDNKSKDKTDSLTKVLLTSIGVPSAFVVTGFVIDWGVEQLLGIPIHDFDPKLYTIWTCPQN